MPTSQYFDTVIVSNGVIKSKHESAFSANLPSDFVHACWHYHSQMDARIPVESMAYCDNTELS